MVLWVEEERASELLNDSWMMESLERAAPTDFVFPRAKAGRTRR